MESHLVILFSMDLHEQLKEIKTQLRLSMNGVASQSMREKGLNYKLNFGVELPRIKEIAARYEQNHALAQALWKENIRECKILATMLQPAESFLPEIADIWIDAIPTIEIAEYLCMNLLRKLSYAPAFAMRLIAEERQYAQVCGYLTIARLLQVKGDMSDRVANEFIDQAISSFLSGDYHLRNAVSVALRCYMEQSQDNAYRLCRSVEGYKDSSFESERLLYTYVASLVDE